MRVTRDGLALMLDEHQLTELDPRDRALTLEITAGTIRHLTLLDAVLKSCLTRPLPKGRHFLHAVLRTALYQAMFLRIPTRAAIHQAVELVKNSPEHPKAGFVNALLRQAVNRNPEELLTTITDPISQLALRHSHPEWMVNRWCQEHGFETTTQRLIANNTPPPLTLRINSLKTDRNSLLTALTPHAQPHPHTPHGIMISKTGTVENLPGYQEGWFAVQDAAAQWPAWLLTPQPGEEILDLCAAPGGKSAQLADLTHNQANILAVDLHAGRLQRLQTNLHRLGATRVTTLHGDATRETVLGERQFHKILADLPCTGTGVIRRHPEIKWRRQPADPTRMAALQQLMLDNVARHLLPGGTLVYAVCSVEPEEGVEQINRFLHHHPNWQRLPIPPSTPFMPDNAITPCGDCRFDPGMHAMDGFFISRLQRLT